MHASLKGKSFGRS